MINKDSPYYIDEPAIISFSGGRSSGYMLFKILEAHGGKLPDNVHVCFANTGKEMPETLDFVRDVSLNWGIEIVWLERFMVLGHPDKTIRKERGENLYQYSMKIVDYDTASRNGEPFESLTLRAYLPNPVARFCTKELKIEAIKDWAKSMDMEFPYLAIIGIRGDEKRRAVKIHNTIEMGQERFCPMYIDGVTASMVGCFWEGQSFDLNLPNNNGVTDFGNCDLCFLKGAKKRLSIISQRPDLVDWWIRMEDKHGSTFRKDEVSYRDMKRIATEQEDMFEDFDDTSIPCFCGD